MKSHAHNAGQPETIYILQDGRAIYVSYYFYLLKI